MELKDYLAAVRRRWRLVALCTLVAAGAAAILSIQTTPQYSSSARLFVSTKDSDSSSAYQGGLFATQRVASYADLVKTRPLAVQVSDDLGGGLDPAMLIASVTARVVPNTVILEVSATHPDAALARDIAEAYARELGTLITELETPSGQDPAIKASVVDDAQVATVPVSPRPARNIALASLLGLFVGFGIAIARELLDTSITSVSDVSAVTSTPILGHINVDTAAVKLEPTAVLSQSIPWAEAFRMLRTNMRYVDVDQEHKLFVITSALPGEGKTTTAVNLAVTMSMANQRVVLVECDLRRPLVASRLGLDSSVGTTNVLIGSVGIREAIQTDQASGLSVLTSGPIPPNPSELLQSKSMESLLAHLRSDFDVVIIDAPPLLPVTDAAVLAAQADGAVVVVRHGRTTRDQLAHALDRLTAVDAEPAGVVINMVPSKFNGTRYGYGYGYGPAPAIAASTVIPSA